MLTVIVHSKEIHSVLNSVVYCCHKNEKVKLDLSERFYLTATDILKCHLICNLQRADLKGKHLQPQQGCYHQISDILIPTKSTRYKK